VAHSPGSVRSTLYAFIFTSAAKSLPVPILGHSQFRVELALVTVTQQLQVTGRYSDSGRQREARKDRPVGAGG
jgi:hypothetical protein